MKDEYDFSNAERGKFFAGKKSVATPVYLEDDVQAYFEAKAKAKGVELGVLINEMLKKDIALIEALD